MRIVLCLLFVLSVVYAQGTTYTWIGGDVWSWTSNSTHWKPTGIPGPQDTIIFPAGSTTTLIGTTAYYIGMNNWYSTLLPYGVIIRATYANVLIQGTLFINSTVSIYATSSFEIAKGGTVQIQGSLGIIDGPGALTIDGTLTILQGMIQGTGATTINTGGLFNISYTQVEPQVDPNNVTEVYVLRNLDIYGNVTMASRSIAHWGFWWESKFIDFNIYAGGFLNLGGGFSKFFEGNIYSFEIYPCSNPIFPATIIINPNGVLNILDSYVQLYHPSIINNGGTITGAYYAVCYQWISIYPYGANYTDTVNPSNSCSWDCRFPWACASPDCFGQYTAPPSSLEYESDKKAEYVYLIPPFRRYEITEKSVLTAETHEDILSCRDSDRCETLYIDLSHFGTHLHAGEPLQFTGKHIIFTNGEEIVVADDVTFIDCTITTNNVVVYFARELHSTGSTFTTVESGEFVFIYLPTSGSDVEAVSYPYYFTNQHFYWEDAFERITLTDSSLRGEMTFVSPARVYGSSGLTIQSGSNIFFEREFKSIAFAGTGPVVIERDAALILGIEVGLYGKSPVDVYGTLQVNSFSAVTSERLIRLHAGSMLNIAGEFESSIDLSECDAPKDYLTSISGQIVHC